MKPTIFDDAVDCADWDESASGVGHACVDESARAHPRSTASVLRLPSVAHVPAGFASDPKSGVNPSVPQCALASQSPRTSQFKYFAQKFS